jgi:hypothetical protein
MSVFDDITHYLAQDLGINPDQITPELIRQKRQELYPKMAVNLNDSIYEGITVRILSRAEIETMSQQSEKFLSQFR